MKITSVIRLSSLNIVFIIIIIIIEQASTFSSEAFRMMLWLSTLVLHLYSYVIPLLHMKFVMQMHTVHMSTCFCLV